jgi:hypothetical protein
MPTQEMPRCSMSARARSICAFDFRTSVDKCVLRMGGEAAL